MSFTVETPSVEDRRFYESEPTFACLNGHSECSVRTGGPCLEVALARRCTCEIDGRCYVCLPSRVAGRRVP